MNINDVFYGQIIDRDNAKALGMKRYFTGEPCKHGHISERRVESSQHCLECSRLQRVRDKEKDKRRKAVWLEDNPDYHQKWRLENEGYYKKYYKRNKNRIREQDSERKKALRKESPKYIAQERVRGHLTRLMRKCGGSKSSDTITTVGYTFDDFQRHIESRMLDGMSWNNTGDWHIDHLYPVSRYITDGIKDPKIVNALNNLAPMWKRHNQDKRDKTLSQWLSEKGEDSEEWELYSRYL